MPDEPNAIERLAGDAPRTGRSVRGVARWAHNPRCGTNNAMFAARIDGDRLLSGTELFAEFGQSPFAIARGARTEAAARRDKYRATFDLLQHNFSYDPAEVVALDLRHGFPRNNAGLRQRQDRTRDAIKEILRNRPGAPNVIDGAVLRANIGGYEAHLEADDLGARAGPLLHALEIKGWPVVDGRADDAGKYADALRQMGIYRYLTMDLVDQLGGDPDVVSAQGLLVTPKNVGLTLIGSIVELQRATDLAGVTLSELPAPDDFTDVEPDMSFGPIADATRPGEERLGLLNELIDGFGNHYREPCLSNCPLAKVCRGRAAASGDPAIAGDAIARFLPGIETLGRAAELSDRAPARDNEKASGVAPVLMRAGELYRAKSAPPDSAVA